MIFFRSSCTAFISSLVASLVVLAAACGDNRIAPDARLLGDGPSADARPDAPRDASRDAPPDAMVGPSGPIDFRFNAPVVASVHAGTSWYFGGSFTRIYTKPAPRLVPLTTGGSVVTTCDLAAGFDSTVDVIVASGTSIYVGGLFTTYKGASANHLAKLDATTCALDTTFSPTAANGFDGQVLGLAVSGTAVFVVGNFSAYRGVADSADSIAKLDLTTGALDTTFSPPGAGNNGFDDIASAVAVSGASVYVGGVFASYRDGGANVSRIAKLDTTSGVLDTTFSPSGQGFNSAVDALLVTGGSLYVGGAFTSYRGVTASAYALAKLDLSTGALDTTFSPVGAGNNGFNPISRTTVAVVALATAGTSLYVGGNFTGYRGIANTSVSLAKLDLTSGAIDTTFSPVGATSNGFGGATVSGLAVSGTSLYCAGSFTTYRGASIPSYIAKLDLSTGARDATFGQPGEVSDFNQPSASVLVAGSTLWVGGQFDWYAGESANRMVKLDDVTFAVDQTFSPPANNGFDRAVDALAASSTSLYVGGNFSAYRSVADSADTLAKLDLTTGALDTTFSPAGAGNNGFDPSSSGVDSLAVAGTSLYVSGYFTAYRTTGDALNVAKLDQTSGALDTTFSPPGANGIGTSSDEVYVLAVGGTSLYAGGAFSTYRGVAASAFSIAKLDLTSGAIDTTFSPVGAGSNGFDAEVSALAVSGTSLYVGGAMRNYRGVATPQDIAKLDLTTGALDTTFAQIGTTHGFDANVFALAASSTALYVGGTFNAYGGVIDAADALAKLDLTTGALDTTFSPPGAGSNGVRDSGGGNVGSVYMIGVAGSAVLVGGDFASYRNTSDPAFFAAKLDATTGARD